MSAPETRQFTGQVTGVYEDLKSFRMGCENDVRIHDVHLPIDNLQLQDRLWLEKGCTVQWVSGHTVVDGVETYISKSRIIAFVDSSEVQPKAE